MKINEDTFGYIWLGMRVNLTFLSNVVFNCALYDDLCMHSDFAGKHVFGFL